MLQFDTDAMMRNCATCHVQPSILHRKGRLVMHCDTCEAKTTSWWTVDAAIEDWNAQMYEASVICGREDIEWTESALAGISDRGRV